jgi:hypothetical protein
LSEAIDIMKASYFLAACALAGTAPTAVAADFDGSKPLICATVEAYECVPEESCESGTPTHHGLPTFLRVNVKAKTIQGTNRTTSIKLIEQTEAQILMMGTELDTGWTMALDRETGGVVVSMSNRDGAAVMFGSCTPL